MSKLINLAERMADRSRPTRAVRDAFFFELGCPNAYLAAEQIERAFGDIEWIPTARIELDRARTPQAARELLVRAELHASELRLPLIASDRWNDEFLPAWRAAAFAAEQGRAGRFVLAASRLAFCGGFELDEPETIVEAASAAGLRTQDALAASLDPRRDAQLFATARGLVSRGVRATPAIRIGGRWFDGRQVVADAAAFRAVRTMYGTTPA